MCGIVGILNQLGEPASTVLLQKMVSTITHRGPDGDGCYNDGPLGLAHCRLAIIDLTSAAHQPMITTDQRHVIVYNGEVYNFQELRVELESLGYQFHSRSDTEVILNAFACWGSNAFKKFNGMFALAIWDRKEKRLYLARDRYGVKPLYYYYKNGLFIFASEIKAILKHPAFKVSVCYSALKEYFTFQNIFSDTTLFEGVKLLQPGHFLTIDQGTLNTPKHTTYWDYVFNANTSLTQKAAEEQLHQLFVQSVNRQLVSDVPVGSYLSGGMDSGSIVAAASKSIPRLTTFTCGFDLSSASGMELNFDERVISEVIANQYKTEHYEVVLHAGDMEYILPQLIWHLEDLRVGQCYPNYYVARLASKFVKVTLSGAGGDELFAGYPWRYYSGVDAQDYYKNYYQFWQRLILDKNNIDFFTPEVYSKCSNYSTYDSFCAIFKNHPVPTKTEDFMNASLYFELKTFLQGLLVVEDKLSMAHSLETRVPFLDNDLVDFALSIPVGMKLDGLDNGKIILRKAMSHLLPHEIVSRKKQGFSAPDASWFRGQSIDYINQLLRDPKAMIYEFIQPKYITGILNEHCSGKINHRLLIWSLLSFEWWCRIFLAGRSFVSSAELILEANNF